MHSRLRVSGKRILVSSFVLLTLVAAMAAIFVPRNHSSASPSKSAQTVHGAVQRAPVRTALVTNAQLQATKATPSKVSAATRAKATNRPLNVTKHPVSASSLPRGISSAAPSGTNLYHTGKLPVLQNKINGLSSADGGGWYPPDQAIGASPGYVAEGVNDAYKVYSSTTLGGIAGPYTAEQIFASIWHAGDFASDPQVTFDATRQRWLTAWLEVDGGVAFDYVDVAVTTGTAPIGVGSYWVYQFNLQVVNSDLFCDYPTLGYDWSGLYVTCVTFSNSTGGFLGNDTFAISLDNTTNGFVGTYDIFFSINNTQGGAYRLSPAIEDEVAQAEYIVTSDAGYGIVSNTIVTCAMTNTAAIPTGTLPTLTCLGNSMPLAYDDPNNAAEPTAGAVVYPGVGFKQIAYRAGRLYFAMPIAITCSGNLHDGIYWGDMAPQLTTFASHNPQWNNGIVSAYTENAYLCYSSADAYMPTLISSSENDLAMVYNYSSSSVYPGIVFTGRANTDAPGTMGQGSSQFVQTGSNPNNSGRWGDYSACALQTFGGGRGIVYCGGEFGGSHTVLNGTGWDTSVYTMRLT